MKAEGTEADGPARTAEGLPPSPTIWQQWAPLPGHAMPNGLAYPVMGVWMIGDEPAGLGIREDDDWVTTFEDRFVPHVIL